MPFAIIFSILRPKREPALFKEDSGDRAELLDHIY